MTNQDLPRVYVLELACDGCDAAETVCAPTELVARGEAYIMGWSERFGLIFCPVCTARPQ